MEDKLVINLANGTQLVAEFFDYDGRHPELFICLKKDGIYMQDICLARPRLDANYDVDANSDDIECLVWSDENDEDYTHKFIIAQYKENE